MTSRWKTVRKTNLRDYANYEFLFGGFTGLASASLGYAMWEGVNTGFGVGFGVFMLLLAAYFLMQKRKEHPRITRTIEDAGGENR